MKKITLTLSLLLLACTPVIHAQLQNINWYFGDRTGLNFATAPPTVLTDNSYLLEGVAATVSDPTSGNLLFYTDGLTVYNSSRSIMRNGEDLFGGGATVIVPYPGFPDKYLIFTTEPFTGFGTGLNYSVVDMTGDLGLGEVVDKNINLLPVSSEKMTITQTTDGSAYWLIVFAPQDELSEDNNTLYSYKIDATGINLVTQATFPFSLENAIAEAPAGQMKVSPDNQSIGLVRNVRYIAPQSGFDGTSTDPNMPPDRVYTFDFDETTGAISNMQSSYGLSGYNTFYGLEFSADSNLLYVTEQSDALRWTGIIYQIQYRNLAAETPVNIIYDSESTVSPLGLQRAYDNKIYAITDDPYYLSVINSPDLIAENSDFVLNSISFDHLTGDVESVRDLPQLVPAKIVVIPDVTAKSARPEIVGNPIKDDLKIKFDDVQVYTVEIYNTVSMDMPTPEPLKTVIYEDMKNKKVYHIDVTDLPADIYYLVITNQQQEIWYDSVIKIQD